MSTTPENASVLPLPRGLKGDAANAWNDLLTILGEDATAPLVPLMTLAAAWVGRVRQLERKLRRTSLNAPSYQRLLKLSATASSQAAKMLGQIRLAVTPNPQRPHHDRN